MSPSEAYISSIDLTLFILLSPLMILQQHFLWHKYKTKLVQIRKLQMFNTIAEFIMIYMQYTLLCTRTVQNVAYNHDLLLNCIIHLSNTYNLLIMEQLLCTLLFISGHTLLGLNSFGVPNSSSFIWIYLNEFSSNANLCMEISWSGDTDKSSVIVFISENWSLCQSLWVCQSKVFNQRLSKAWQSWLLWWYCQYWSLLLHV